MNEIYVDGNEVEEYNICLKEDNFLTNYGILIENPKDSCGDEFKITVPEEKLEGSISIKQGSFNQTEELEEPAE